MYTTFVMSLGTRYEASYQFAIQEIQDRGYRIIAVKANQNRISIIAEKVFRERSNTV